MIKNTHLGPAYLTMNRYTANSINIGVTLPIKKTPFSLGSKFF